MICTEYEIYGSFKKFWGRKEYSNIANDWLKPAHIRFDMHPPPLPPTHTHTHNGTVHSLLNLESEYLWSMTSTK